MGLTAWAQEQQAKFEAWAEIDRLKRDNKALQDKNAELMTMLRVDAPKLRQIQADAVLTGFDAIFSNFDFGQYGCRLGLLDDIEALFMHYANRIKEGAL